MTIRLPEPKNRHQYHKTLYLAFTFSSPVFFLRKFNKMNFENTSVTGLASGLITCTGITFISKNSTESDDVPTPVNTIPLNKN